MFNLIKFNQIMMKSLIYKDNWNFDLSLRLLRDIRTNDTDIRKATLRFSTSPRTSTVTTIWVSDRV